jgi:hypothetical protein
MSTDNVFRIGGPNEPSKPPTEATRTDSAEFRRLLEQLEELSKSSQEKVVADADDLKDALRKAEDDYLSAMDLRRKLEEAFRRSQS